MSGDREHIARAKRILEETLRRVPAEHHEGMLANIRNNREVVVASQREFGAGTEDDAASPWSEQETEGW